MQTRHLLQQPCSLEVVSRPFDDYPQELALVISAPEHVTESTGNFAQSFPPDDDIARDLAVLLTVFLRRLVTVYVKVRRTHLYNPRSPLDTRRGAFDVLLPIVNAATAVAWNKKPIEIGWGLGGVESIRDYNPSPLGVDPERLASQLVAVASIRYGDTFLLAARLYAQALRIIEDWPDIAYQLLVFCVETLANKAFRDYSPPREKMVEVKGKVVKLATKYGLTDQQADDLAVVACSGMGWALEKFRMFLSSARDKVNKSLPVSQTCLIVRVLLPTFVTVTDRGCRVVPLVKEKLN